jgi:Peptidase M61 N-terminal domain
MIFSGLKTLSLSMAVLAVGTMGMAAQSSQSGAAPTITLSVDATDAPRKMFHAHLTIPVAPGVLTLYYPKWLPGEHGPTGPIQELAGVRFTGNGQLLKWRRDLLDAWTFHVEIPQGV